MCFFMHTLVESAVRILHTLLNSLFNESEMAIFQMAKQNASRLNLIVIFFFNFGLMNLNGYCKCTGIEIEKKIVVFRTSEIGTNLTYKFSYCFRIYFENIGENKSIEIVIYLHRKCH